MSRNFSSVFLIAELRGVEERKNKLKSGQGLSRANPGVTLGKMRQCGRGGGPIAADSIAELIGAACVQNSHL